MQYFLFSDGGSRSNPGPAGCGFLFYKADAQLGQQMFGNLAIPQDAIYGSAFLGEQTNNYAEYAGLIWGLNNAKAAGVKKIQVFVDSNLLASQINGKFKVKAQNLKPLYASAKDISMSFNEFSIEHVYRDGNKIADKLANIAMDSLEMSGNYLVELDKNMLGSQFVQPSLF